MATDSEVGHAGIPFRIRIGVVGERILPDKEGVAEKLTGILDTDPGLRVEGSSVGVIYARLAGRARRSNPRVRGDKSELAARRIIDLFDEDSKERIRGAGKTRLAFTVVTSLGGEADRIVAREVLKLSDSRIEVALPVPKEDFLEEFDSLESLQEFEALFRQARRPVALRQRRLADDYPALEIEAARLKALEEAGRYIVDHCDVLVAVQSPLESNAGVISSVVQYANVRERPIARISTHLPFSVSFEKGHGLNARAIDAIERFNSYAISDSDRQRYKQNAYHDLFGQGREVPEETKRQVGESLVLFYTRASAIAKRNQILYRRAGAIVYLFSAAAVAAVAAAVLIEPLHIVGFAIELALLLTILVVVIVADRRRTHKNWIENRFVAERVRSAEFLAACGVEVSPINVPPYLGNPDQPDDWMARVFNEVWGRLPSLTGLERDRLEPLVTFIRDRWIKRQIRYHHDNAGRAGRKSHLLEGMGASVFFIALAAAALHITAPFVLHSPAWFEDSLTFIAIAFPAVGAAIGGIRAHREYSRLARRSKNMEVSLKRLDERFAAATTPDVFEGLLREAEQLMLMETQDWLMLMAFAKLEAAA